MGKVHGEVVGAALPRRIFWPWYLAMPLEHIHCSIRVLNWFGHKAERVITAPFLTLLLQPIDH